MLGGAYVRREICVSKSIGLACSGKEIYHFCFVLLCIRGQIPSTSPPGGLYSEGQFNRGFFALWFWGAYIWRGLYTEGLICGILRHLRDSPDCVSIEVQLLCCGISCYRLFPAPWDVESAYYSESPAEQWCIQSYKSQIHGSSNSTALCECLWCLIVKLF